MAPAILIAYPYLYKPLPPISPCLLSALGLGFGAMNHGRRAEESSGREAFL